MRRASLGKSSSSPRYFPSRSQSIDCRLEADDWVDRRRRFQFLRQVLSLGDVAVDCLGCGTSIIVRFLPCLREILRQVRNAVVLGDFQAKRSERRQNWRDPASPLEEIAARSENFQLFVDRETICGSVVARLLRCMVNIRHDHVRFFGRDSACKAVDRRPDFSLRAAVNERAEAFDFLLEFQENCVDGFEAGSGRKQRMSEVPVGIEHLLTAAAEPALIEPEHEMKLVAVDPAEEGRYHGVGKRRFRLRQADQCSRSRFAPLELEALAV